MWSLRLSEQNFGRVVAAGHRVRSAALPASAVVINVTLLTFGKIVPDVVYIPVAVMFIAAMLVAALHDQALCVLCSRNFPLNPTGVVARNMKKLKYYHSWQARWGSLIAYVFVIALMWLPHLTWPTFAVFPFLLAYAIFDGRVRHIHSVVRPWCPYCHRWDDGDDDDTKVPDPDPAGSRSV